MIEKFATDFENAIMKLAKPNLLNKLLMAQQNANRAAKIARKLYEEYEKSR
jgi:hypothetical protein